MSHILRTITTEHITAPLIDEGNYAYKQTPDALAITTIVYIIRNRYYILLLLSHILTITVLLLSTALAITAHAIVALAITGINLEVKKLFCTKNLIGLNLTETFKILSKYCF